MGQVASGTSERVEPQFWHTKYGDGLPSIFRVSNPKNIPVPDLIFSFSWHYIPPMGISLLVL
jgi:hypothetical protein